MLSVYDSHAPKKATNLSINSDLLKKAKTYKINLSQHFEAYLDQLVKREEEKRWIEENHKAIEAQNERVEKYGTFSDGLRRF